VNSKYSSSPAASSVAVIVIAAIHTRPGYYTARCDGRLLCRSRQPLLDGARALLESGYSADSIVVMRSVGSTVDRLRSTIVAAARLTVKEPDRGAPHFAKWKPFPSSPVAPPIAPLGQASVRQPDHVLEAEGAEPR
jgi:hypothetical protein